MTGVRGSPESADGCSDRSNLGCSPPEIPPMALQGPVEKQVEQTLRLTLEFELHFELMNAEMRNRVFGYRTAYLS